MDISTERFSNTLPRLGLIGPVLPYRGGIAQYTTMLHRALSSRSELLTFSFKRLYPEFLYPGTSQFDPWHEDHSEPGVHHALDSINPFTWRKVCRLLAEHGPHTVIITWWTIFLSPCFGYIAKYLRNRDIRMIFLCHNVIDHEYALWKAELTRLILSLSDAFLVHTGEEAVRLRGLIRKGARIVTHPHPVFHQFPQAIRSLPRRSRLELLFFGFVRPYKGLDILLKAMHLLKKEDVFLTVAGEWWDRSPLRELMNDEFLRDKVEIIERYISEQEAGQYFSRADIVILPYRSATSTGVIPLAYHYGKPVIATKVGGFPDVVNDGISGRLIQPEDPYALAEVIREFLHTSPAEMREGVRNAAAAMTWESLSEHLLEFADST